MQNCRIRFVLALLTSAIAGDRASAVEKTTVRKFPITEWIEIQFAAPVSWIHEIPPAPLGLPATLEFKPKSGMPFHVLLTPIGQSGERSVEPLRKQVESMAKIAQEQSVEKTIELAELKSDTVTGFSFSITDRAPKPDEFKYLSSGVVRVSDAMMTFTILTNDGQQDVVQKAFAMIRSAKGVATEIRLVQTVIAIPEANWSIGFDGPELGKKQESRRGKDYAVRAGAERFNLSIFVEQPHGDGESHEVCYKFYWNQLNRNPKIAKETVTATAHDRYHRVQYDVVINFDDKIFTQRNVNYFFVYEKRWVDVHFSIVEPTDEDAKVIAAFDKTLQYKKRR